MRDKTKHIGSGTIENVDNEWIARDIHDKDICTASNLDDAKRGVLAFYGRDCRNGVAKGGTAVVEFIEKTSGVNFIVTERPAKFSESKLRFGRW